MLKTARSPLFSLYEATHFSFSSQTPGFKRKSSWPLIIFSSHSPPKHQQPLCKQQNFQEITSPSEDAHLTINTKHNVISKRVHVSYVANVFKMFTYFFSFATEKLIWRLRCNGFTCWILIYLFFSPSGNCLLHFSSFVQTYSNNFYLPYNATSKSYSLVLKFRRSVRRRVVSYYFHPISLPITISLIKLTKIARRSFWKLSFESINHASGFR